MSSLLEVSDLACYRDEGIPIFSQVDFVVNEGDVVVLRGLSGCGRVLRSDSLDSY